MKINLPEVDWQSKNWTIPGQVKKILEEDGEVAEAIALQDPVNTVREVEELAFFFEAGLAAAGGREKMRLCEKCGLSLTYVLDQGYCCPRGHGCWFPREGEEIVIRDSLSAIYAGGAIEFKDGSRAGKKRKKPPKKAEFQNIFDRP